MPILLGQCKKQSKTVEKKDLPKVKRDAKQMVVLCRKRLGRFPFAYAIAHCQIDHANPLRFFVLLDGRIIINPRVAERSIESVRETEGCYSYPFRNEVSVKRFKTISVSYFEIIDGEMVPKEEFLKDIMCRIFQHEMDHMNGKAIYP